MYCKETVVYLPEILLEAERCIQESLLLEVGTTPKPGLVDKKDNGAHKDMSYITFVQSTHAVTPYLLQMMWEGYRHEQEVKMLFPVIREIGKRAERAMYRKTNGVNTHKGAIFTLGILCGAAGYCYRKYQKMDAGMILDISKEMCASYMQKDFLGMKRKNPSTSGEYLYLVYGEKGIRGQAEKGFPIIREISYPLMKQYQRQNREPNAANINVLLMIMQHLNDTNILSRSGYDYDTLHQVQEVSGAILEVGGAFCPRGTKCVERLNEICIQKNISPGGSADILAATLLLCSLENLGGNMSWKSRRRRKI